MKNHFLLNFFRNIFFIWIYVSSLIFSVYTLSDKWSYQKIEFHQQNIIIYIFIYLFSIIPLPFFKTKIEKPSDYVNLYLYFFTYIPSVVVPFFLRKTNSFEFEYIIYLIVLTLSIIYLLKNNTRKFLILNSLKPLNKNFFFFLIFLIYSISTISFITSFGLKFNIPSFSEIYDIREEYKEVTRGNIITRYLVGWIGYILNIFLFIYGLSKRNKFLIIFTIIFQIYIFSLMALKSHLATFILAYILYLYFKKYNKIRFNLFLFLLSTSVILFSILDLIIGEDIFQTLVIRRIMIVPSQLSYFHFEFFIHNEKTYWAYSFLKYINEYSYNAPPPNIIGNKYFNKPNMTAVVNFFIEGYTAFGYFGVIIVTIIFKKLMQIIDYIYVYKTNRSNLLIVSVLSITNIFNSTSIFTLILTHGILILIIIYSITPFFNNKKKHEYSSHL